MDAYPLIFRFSSVVASDRFRARVRGTGRAVALLEDGEWSCSGVEAADLTEPGTSPVDAFLLFRKSLDECFAQLAEDSASIEDFAGRVSDFFLWPDALDRERWQAALDELRRRSSDLPEDIARLPREAAEMKPEVEIEGANVFHEQKELLSLAAPEPLTRAA